MTSLTELVSVNLATQAAEYASAMASVFAMALPPWNVEFIWSGEAVALAWHVRGWPMGSIVEAWAETAARLMTGEYR